MMFYKVKFFTEKVKKLFINTSLSEASPLSKRTLSVCQTLSMLGSKQLLVVSGVAQRIQIAPKAVQ